MARLQQFGLGGQKFQKLLYITVHTIQYRSHSTESREQSILNVHFEVPKRRNEKKMTQHGRSIPFVFSE